MRKILLVVGIIVALFYLATASVAFNGKLYEKYQEKHGVTVEHKEEINTQLIDYFLEKGGMPDVFSEREKSHLKDVKSFFTIFALLFWILFFIGVYVLSSVDLVDAGFKAGIGVLVILFVLMIFPFEQVFVQFHYLFFPAETWRFTEASMLIQLYPVGFFYDMFYSIVYRVAGMAVLLIGYKFVTIRN